VTIIHLGESSCTHTRLMIFHVGTGEIGRMCCSASDRKRILMPPPRIYMTAYVMEIKRPKLYRSTGNILFRKELILHIYIHTLHYGGGFNRYSTAWRVYVTYKNRVPAEKHSVEQFYFRTQICTTSYNQTNYFMISFTFISH